MIKQVNWTEIVNLAGQMHNLHQDPYMPLDEAHENEMARKILKELGLDTSELLEKIGEIESLVAEPGHIGFDDPKNEQIDNKCFDLRYMITNVIGE